MSKFIKLFMFYLTNEFSNVLYSSYTLNHVAPPNSKYYFLNIIDL